MNNTIEKLMREIKQCEETTSIKCDVAADLIERAQKAIKNGNEMEIRNIYREISRV